ncbi:MAG TPA: SRPBCC family protein [Acidimicrobiia bacterium]|nr:SRPBCC family protein [Acidimicrobiia bacterium]
MAHFHGSIRTAWSVDEAFAYMADLRNFAEWDPGTHAVAQVRGSGSGPGAAYDVEVHVGRPTMTLHYEIVEWDPPRRLLARGDNAWLVSYDEITVEAEGALTVVTYDARIELRGVLGVLDGLVDRGFQTTGKRAAAGLHGVLAGAPDGGSASP